VHLTRPPRATALTLLAVTALLLGLVPAQAGTAAGRDPVPPHDATFRIATFNILGSQHTAGPGGWGPGPRRARLTARILEDRRIDMVGLQEVQEDQLRVLEKRLDGYELWPGDSLGGGGMRLQIAYRTAKFELMGSGSITTVFDHQRRPIPWVRLKNRGSDRQIYVVDVHNSPREQEADRDRATRKEVRLINELRATRRAVFVVGDMNEHEEVFCKIVGQTDLRSAAGGSATSVKRCVPPAALRIDWIFGSGASEFSDYRAEYDARIRRASDHNLVSSLVTMRARPQG
jgi:endonuclease/exonuclease/phosphatase family metal-dependent hydrolase